MRRESRRVRALIFSGLAAIAIGALPPTIVRAQISGGEESGGIRKAGRVQAAFGSQPLQRQSGDGATPSQAGGAHASARRRSRALSGADVGNGSSALPPGTYTAAGSPANAAGAATGVTDSRR